ncbi:MAG: head GIN domain-containing protein [Bacteroides sp.]
MKQFLMAMVTITLLIFSTKACSQTQHIVASKNYITKKVKVDNFSKISLTGSPDIIYTQSDGKPSVQIYGSDNIVNIVKTVVEGETLVVKFSNNTIIQNSGKLEIRVSTPKLTEVNVAGSGDITLVNGIKEEKSLSFTITGSGGINGSGISCRNLSLSVQGSGDIRLSRIANEETRVNVIGSGDIELEGNSRVAEFNVNGSGNINAETLKVENLNARVSGSGDISCYATKNLKARVIGSGEIAYKGNPQLDSSKKGVHKL